MNYLAVSLFLAQALSQVDVVDTPEDVALLFNGPQFFTALISGVVLAFAFQLLLTNLGVATGISLTTPSSPSSSHSSDKDHKSSPPSFRTIGTALGIATLITVTISLFCASLLAVKLSLLVSPLSGAIIGLVIWGVYFTLLVWISSTTIGSFMGSLINTATSGFQALMGTATSIIGAKAANQQVVKTAKEAAAAVRHELGSGLDPISFREQVEDYLQGLHLPTFNFSEIASDFDRLLNAQNWQDVTELDSLQKINRDTFAEWISDRSDLSKADIDRLADRLEQVWQNKIKDLVPSRNPLSELADILKNAPREQLLGSGFTQKLDDLVGEMRQRRKAEHPDWLSQSMMLGLNSLVGLVVGRSDLSDLDADKIVGQLQQLQSYVGDQKAKVSHYLNESGSQTPLRTDIKHYLLNANPWQLRKVTLESDFRQLLYDPDADPTLMVSALKQVSRSDFKKWLSQKGLLTQEKIQSTADTLENIRLEVLETAKAAHEREKRLHLFADVESYLVTAPREELMQPETMELHFKPILEDWDSDYETLRQRLALLDRNTLERLLAKRSDLIAEDAVRVTVTLEEIRDRVLQAAHDYRTRVKDQTQQQWLKVKEYLKNTGKYELNPDLIERELKLLLQDPQSGAAALQERVSHFDRDTLVQLLNQRDDLSEEQINDILDQVEQMWTQVSYVPRQLIGQAQTQYEEAKSALADYLHSTGKEELNPEGIQRDLNQVLQNPQLGFQRIKHRLAMMDRDTLVQLLSQRDDLSEEQVNDVINSVQDTLQQLVKAPRRIALRTQEKVQDFQESLADYLRATDKAELSPEGIQRDLKLLLNDPRAGLQSWQERLSHFDRETLVAILSQREDLSEAEVNRVIDQIFSVRDQMLAQVERVKHAVQSAIDRILSAIRNYLNSLQRPELNYDGIKTDLRQLFDDPEAGFGALKDRFSQVDRDTLIALLSSRKDISEADANRLVEQVEHTRDRLLGRAERMQRQAQMYLEDMKTQAQQQLIETQKAAAAAAWWVFWTALISAIAAAGAGALGVVD